MQGWLGLRPNLDVVASKSNPVYATHSSSSIGTAILVGFGLLNYHWVFSAGRFLQNAVASGTSNPQLGGPMIRTFQLPPPGVPHIWNNASEPQQRKVELWARNFREFCRKWRLSRHFRVLLHAENLRHGTDGFTSPPKEGALRIFSPEKSDGFGQVWTHELGYQRPPKPFATQSILAYYCKHAVLYLFVCLCNYLPLTSLYLVVCLY